MDMVSKASAVIFTILTITFSINWKTSDLLLVRFIKWWHYSQLTFQFATPFSHRAIMFPWFLRDDNRKPKKESLKNTSILSLHCLYSLVCALSFQHCALHLQCNQCFHSFFSGAINSIIKRSLSSPHYKRIDWTEMSLLTASCYCYWFLLLVALSASPLFHSLSALFPRSCHVCM